ncbi:hypothetical protein ACFRFQ_13905 [Rhodococcus sp. NPDC056743]|uniref:hypothetical protein n=1 Tax=Rhodococcus sp. NPDC056743 TaxID=3345934 RepID=UPI0036728140
MNGPASTVSTTVPALIAVVLAFAGFAKLAAAQPIRDCAMHVGALPAIEVPS